MRDLKTFGTDIIHKPPLLFPFVALFHVLWLIFTAWNVHNAPFPSIEWLQLLWMACFTICWIASCDLRKWGAIGYLALTVLNIILRFAIKNHNERELFTNALFPVDLMFSFFVLFYYKKFK